MNYIEKALAMIAPSAFYEINPENVSILVKAFKAAIEQHEAFRREVSDAVEHCRACSDPEAWTRIKFELERFIISKPDPLQDILLEEYGHVSADADAFRAALAKRGLKIVEDV